MNEEDQETGQMIDQGKGQIEIEHLGHQLKGKGVDLDLGHLELKGKELDQMTGIRVEAEVEKEVGQEVEDLETGLETGLETDPEIGPEIGNFLKNLDKKTKVLKKIIKKSSKNLKILQKKLTQILKFTA